MSRSWQLAGILTFALTAMAAGRVSGGDTPGAASETSEATSGGSEATVAEPPKDSAAATGASTGGAVDDTAAAAKGASTGGAVDDTAAAAKGASTGGAVDDTAAAWKQLEIRPGGSWVECRFGGDGPVEIKDGTIALGFGDPLTGVRWEGPFPRQDYEISLEARRTGGFDFFCGLTLPVGDQRCSLILGGWGGSLVGISSIDGLDAANNETTFFQNFEQNRWYKVRMEVTQEHLRAWLDDAMIFDWERDERPLDIRGEMEETTPVGIAAFQCESQIRNVRVRQLGQRTKDTTSHATKEEKE